MVTDHITLFDMIVGAIYQADGNVNLAAEKVCYGLSHVTPNEFLIFKRVWKRKLHEEELANRPLKIKNPNERRGRKKLSKKI